MSREENEKRREARSASQDPPWSAEKRVVLADVGRDGVMSCQLSQRMGDPVVKHFAGMVCCIRRYRHEVSPV